jgi:hypothetical protein
MLACDEQKITKGFIQGTERLLLVNRICETFSEAKTEASMRRIQPGGLATRRLFPEQILADRYAEAASENHKGRSEGRTPRLPPAFSFL